MRRTFFLFARSLLAWAVLFSLISSEPLKAKDGEEWLKITSANFELYTNASANRGQELVRFFEQIRGFFLRASPSAKPRSKPIRLVAFRTEKEFASYNDSKYAAAYYLSAPDADYIVMGKLQVEHQEIAVHEFMHLLVNETGARFPPWLNEGLAELYSTLTPQGKRIKVGDLIPGRFQLLQDSKWLDFQTLLSIDHETAHNQERKDAGIFYAQSWALVHMLQLSPDYQPAFPDLMLALARKVSGGDALSQVYGKPLSEIEKDLRGYLSGGRFYAAFFDVQLDKSAEKPQVEPASELESGLVLAKLLSHISKEQEARQMYESLALSHPQSPQIPMELGYLALYSQDFDQARQRFARASELGAGNARMHYDHAHLLRRANADAQEIIAALRRAVQLRPDYNEAHRFLGSMLMQTRNYGAAYSALAKVKNVDTRDDARWLYYNMAFAQLELGGLDGATQYANKALEYSDSPEEVSRVHGLLKHVEFRRAAKSRQEASASLSPLPEDSTPAPPVIRRTPLEPEKPREPLRRREHVSGELVEVECAGDTAVLHVIVDGERRKFTIGDPKNVAIRGGSGAIDFTCGPQDKRFILIGYEVEKEIVLSIEFL